MTPSAAVRNTAYRRWGKRALDLALASTALLLFAPVMGAIALAVRLRMGRPVVFSQQRPGLQGQPFTLYKFRTMTDARDADGNLLADTERLTSLGRFLRATSLDELPEMLNVLKGEMSLVGPRPLLTRYLPYYSSEERSRFSVRPGITGWAQVNGRNQAGWDDRLAMDVWYVRNFSLLLDLRILVSTVLCVCTGTGVETVPGEVMLSLDEERAGATHT